MGMPGVADLAKIIAQTVRATLRSEIDQRCSITAIHWVGILCLDVRFQGQSGKHMIALSFSAFDPGCVKNELSAMIRLAICRGAIHEALR
jgi:hypothetical protein